MQFGTRAGRLVAVLALSVLVSVAVFGTAAASVRSELAFHRGVVAYGENQLDEAKRQFEVVLSDDPEDTVALHYLALVAQKAGDVSAALALYDRALALDPEDPDIVLDRGIALMDAGRLPEARQAFSQVIEMEPDRARAHLFAGIAAYRAGDYETATPSFERAGALDSSLLDEARYYTGLSDVFLGNLEAAALAFGDAAQQSPLSPLGQSAQNFRQQLAALPQAERSWQASVTTGMEFDSNPLIFGDTPLSPSPDSDWRGVLRTRGSYRVIQREGATLTAGYDGFWSFHVEENVVNLQTHSPWLSAGYSVGPVRLGLRYDYAFTFLDTTEPFRHLHRVTPSASIREGDWGASYLYYQFHYQDFLRNLLVPATFDRDGTRHMVGFNQLFFLPAPFTYVRSGVLGDRLRTDGTEWEYDGIEATFGAGYDFDYDISLGWLYRFWYRDYENPSALSATLEKRNEYRHILTIDIAKAITEHWEVSLGGAFHWNRSNVGFYQFDRQVGGSYVTYRF